jgi:hypothetical protein
LISQLQGFKYDNLSEIQKLTIPRIVENFLIRFRKSVNDSHFQFEIAQWMYDNKQFGYSYIILTESIISKMVEKLSETGNSEFTSIKEVKKKRDFAKANLDYSIKSIYRKVNTRRISVAHAKESGKSIRESVNELKQALKDVKEFIY